MIDRASELRAIADGRLMLNVRNGVTVSRSMLAMIADEIDALRAAPLTPAEVGGHADAQTEARAIARKLQDVIEGHSWRLNIDKATDIIATALAAKDAELEKVKAECDKWREAFGEMHRQTMRAEASLVEKDKALDALGTFAFWFRKYPEFKPTPDMQAEMLADLDRAQPFIPTRRALEAQGGE